MGTSSRAKLLMGVSLLGLRVQAAWPVKTVDLTNGGDDCDTLTEQYLQVEGYDFHDHPKFSIRWRQITGPCGESVGESDLRFWEVFYDGSHELAEEDPPTRGGQGRVQLNLLVCSPFGEYELDMDIESYSDEGSTRQQRTSWAIKDGPDQYNIWDTVNTDFAYDEDYSPTAPGVYTWPFQGATDYFSTIIAGPLPPLECSSNAPEGTEMVGCFSDSPADRLFNSDSLVRSKRGPGGMTTQICSDFCAGFLFFGVEFGRECFCGTTEEFGDEAAVSDSCGASVISLCTGDPTEACGGFDAINVYRRTQYSSVGCFQDAKASRILAVKGSASTMSAEICYEQCNNGINTHFGTQYSIECWCGADADLTKNGDVLPSDECDMLCAGTTTGEFCGASYKMTAYEIEDKAPVNPDYVGCYNDGLERAMDAEGKKVTGDMTNQVCVSYCADNGHAYAGTQYSEECWCGDSFDLYGEISGSSCTYPCQGDAWQICGGLYALSVYSTG